MEIKKSDVIMCEFYPKFEDETYVCYAGSDISGADLIGACTDIYSKTCQWANHVRKDFLNYKSEHDKGDVIMKDSTDRTIYEYWVNDKVPKLKSLIGLFLLDNANPNLSIKDVSLLIDDIYDLIIDEL